MDTNKKRLLTGDRPTGRLHLGNYFGSIINRVKLQDQYACFFMIADLHMLTTDFDRTQDIKENILSIAIDWISSGINPEKSVFFIQSKVPAHSFMHLIFSMLVSVPRLERIPTLKDKVKESRFSDENAYSYGLLGYPVLQAADILAYKASVVPVGEDQISHVELTREIARRFNYTYGEVFPEPRAILSETSRVPGIDGINVKMSKSLNNEISLSHSFKEVRDRVMKMVTDPAKIRLTDRGHPQVCTVFSFYNILAAPELIDQVKYECENGQIGCVACKERLSELVNRLIEPIREKRFELERNPSGVWDILHEGTKNAIFTSNKTVSEMISKMKLNY
ncbi:MAG: Tryptophan--tRNA ligase [candidate division WS2 bacterium]|uniref:Tryptophan--tRNA ligase n=1 Tax=Psychracetigena formicireducens TaxID=2986056 RepID=A0A9E2BIJ5_PSYF1|nr:Tryptophan--tRNA ligase [Candidatus Psychracetigena formicireducens]MBT9144790.1 Tryptophan--tRNA ligase [Candidatus Psychracetigena formicireducens]